MKQRLSRPAGFAALILSALVVAASLAAGTVFAGGSPGPPKPPGNKNSAVAVLLAHVLSVEAKQTAGD